MPVTTAELMVTLLPVSVSPAPLKCRVSPFRLMLFVAASVPPPVMVPAEPELMMDLAVMLTTEPERIALPSCTLLPATRVSVPPAFTVPPTRLMPPVVESLKLPVAEALSRESVMLTSFSVTLPVMLILMALLALRAPPVRFRLPVLAMERLPLLALRLAPPGAVTMLPTLTLPAARLTLMDGALSFPRDMLPEESLMCTLMALVAVRLPVATVTFWLLKPVSEMLIWPVLAEVPTPVACTAPMESLAPLPLPPLFRLMLTRVPVMVSVGAE